MKQIKSLRHKKYRQKYGEFLIEGIRLLEEAISGGARIRQIWHSQEFTDSERGVRLSEEIIRRNLPYKEATLAELKALSDTVHNQGIVATVDLPDVPEAEHGKSANWLYLDQIRDPGNLGTILRTADWFGLKHVGLSRTCVDAYNPKVVRAGMGAHFHLFIHGAIDLLQIKEMGHVIIGADQTGNPVGRSPLTNTKFCLVLGNEARGISEEIKAIVDHFIAIPGTGKAESLNVAVAGGILMHLLQHRLQN